MAGSPRQRRIQADWPLAEARVSAPDLQMGCVMPQRSPPGWSADRTARRVTAANRFRRKAQAIGLWTVNLIGRPPVSHILGYARVSTDDKTSPVRERAHRIR